MSDTVIRVENLSKVYRLGQIGTGTLTNDLKIWWARARGKPNPLLKIGEQDHGNREGEFIWALKEVSFSVQQGEVLGIIGRNGAGKSTLLKILSRVTAPTSGLVKVKGRIASLLEVGTGFHPELTGRENIYLNGAILGMSRREVERKFDEIVNFAEVEQFIDTPVKRYSSGMYVRLAFAVAAHLEPEILLVDEVLAVGDAAFQQKCLAHMRGLTQSGATVLFVSHNMAAIQSSCNRAIFLKKGQISTDGGTLEAIETYRQSTQQRNTQEQEEISRTPSYAWDSSAGIEINGFEMFGEDGVDRREFNFGEAIRIKIYLNARQRFASPMINFGIRRGDGVSICNFNNWYDNFKIDYIEGPCVLEGWLPPLRLIPNYYEIHLLVWPWGGAHLVGDMVASRPLATRVMGDFRIDGPALNVHDGVYQAPAIQWRFQRGDFSIDYQNIPNNAIELAFRSPEKS